jgi:hypothetical protein
VSRVWSADALQSSDPDQRVLAAATIGNTVDLIDPDDQPRMERALIGALADPDIRVREFVAAPLRAFGTSDARAALATALEDPNASELLFGQATGMGRLPSGQPLDERIVPASAVAAVRSIAPDFLNVLSTPYGGNVWQLIEGIGRAKNPATTPVLVWALQHVSLSYQANLGSLLTQAPHVERLPIDELIAALGTADPDHRLAIVKVLGRLLGPPISSDDQNRIFAALLERVNDPNLHVQQEAIGVLGNSKKYRRSDAPSVRYTAELQWTNFTGRPNYQLWLDTLQQQAGTPYQAMARDVLAFYAVRDVKAQGRDLVGLEREELVSAALTREAVDARYMPRTPPQAASIRQARRNDRFGLVEVIIMSGRFAEGGYSMLFERRDDRWIFLTLANGWVH